MWYLIFVLLLACGPVTVDSTAPLTKETCESALIRAEDLADAYMEAILEKDDQYEACTDQLNKNLDKLATCNTLTNAYESQLLNTDFAIGEESDGDNTVYPGEETLLGNSGPP